MKVFGNAGFLQRLPADPISRRKKRASGIAEMGCYPRRDFRQQAVDQRDNDERTSQASVGPARESPLQ